MVEVWMFRGEHMSNKHISQIRQADNDQELA